jgi:hypothetical protein
MRCVAPPTDGIGARAGATAGLRVVPVSLPVTEGMGARAAGIGAVPVPTVEVVRVTDAGTGAPVPGAAGARPAAGGSPKGIV